MDGVRRGDLTEVDVPESGEVVDRLVEQRGVKVQQILSGAVDLPIEFDQDDDEWVTVLTGRAVLQVAGEEIVMATGSWVYLPSRTLHRLVSVDPGTRWLAVTIAPEPRGG